MSSLPPGLAGRKILVVDDEPTILKILSFKLRLTGLQPVEATGGEEALRMVREESPDLVLLDVSLTPGLTGFDVCRILKENPATSRLPIVMLTARTLPVRARPRHAPRRVELPHEAVLDEGAHPGDREGARAEEKGPRFPGALLNTSKTIRVRAQLPTLRWPPPWEPPPFGPEPFGPFGAV